MPLYAEHSTRLNRISPYFTRFPLQFPLVQLAESHAGQWLLDPFCGAGTSLFAARLLGLGSVGVDSSRVAAAIARAKLQRMTPEAVIAKAVSILEQEQPVSLPEGDFWNCCYTPAVLEALCRFRSYFMVHNKSSVDVVLCAMLLGMLHGPKTEGTLHFFSNHIAADFAPLPQEAMSLWRERSFKPPQCNVLDMIQQRADYLFAEQPPCITGTVHEEDSREISFVDRDYKFDWIITSPPYYGMNSYTTDQWLRDWFLGGSPFPEEKTGKQIAQTTPDTYVADLAKVWKNAAEACNPGARLIVRVGDVSGITAPPATELFQASLNHAAVGWQLRDQQAVCRDVSSPKTSPLFNSPALWPRNETEIGVCFEP